MSAYPLLANEKYARWCDRACAQLHFNFCKEGRTKLEKEHWYELFRKSLDAGHEINAAILCNQGMKNDITIPNNILVIVIRVIEKGTFLLIDIEISGDKNVIKKEGEIFIYKHLTIKDSVCRMSK